MVKIKYSDAILEAIDDSMNKNNSVIIMGLGITDPKAVLERQKGF